jgi:hypothetical protein
VYAVYGPNTFVSSVSALKDYAFALRSWFSTSWEDPLRSISSISVDYWY